MSSADEWHGPERRTPVGWHVGKEIPLTVLFALIVQTAGGIWWLSQVSGKIDYAINTMQTFQTERYTRDDARRDKELFLAIQEAQRARTLETERRIAVLETYHKPR